MILWQFLNHHGHPHALENTGFSQIPISCAQHIMPFRGAIVNSFILVFTGESLFFQKNNHRDKCVPVAMVSSFFQNVSKHVK